ncbi:MAG: SoxR reducing system RseC family protein [Clostridiales bacterium]|nr:SoxR reducing system RseC family protein [Clostridiales bacterium]
MTQSAIVKRILGDGCAEVHVERISACGKSCASCGGSCSEKNIISVRAVNLVRAKPGDRVVIESATSGVLGAAMLVYFVPILFFFSAYVISALLKLPEAARIVISVAAFMLGAACVYVINRYVRKDKPMEYTIVSVMEDICLDM